MYYTHTGNIQSYPKNKIVNKMNMLLTVMTYKYIWTILYIVWINKNNVIAFAG